MLFLIGLQVVAPDAILISRQGQVIPRLRDLKPEYADYQPIGAKRKTEEALSPCAYSAVGAWLAVQCLSSSLQALPGPFQAGRVHPRLHHEPEKTELRPSQGRAGEAQQQDRDPRLYPGGGPQPPRALGRPRARRPGQGPPGRPLPHRSRSVGHSRRRRSQQSSLPLRNQETEVAQDTDLAAEGRLTTP